MQACLQALDITRSPSAMKAAESPEPTGLFLCIFLYWTIGAVAFRLSRSASESHLQSHEGYVVTEKNAFHQLNGYSHDHLYQ
jgi:hypothetical protein